MTKKSDKISRWFRDKVLLTKVWVLAGYSPLEAFETIEHKVNMRISKEEFELNRGIHMLVRDNKKRDYHIIWIEKRTGFYELMHECLHLVKDALVPMGIPFNHMNDELIAYYQEYWFRRIWKAVGKEKRDKKTKS